MATITGKRRVLAATAAAAALLLATACGGDSEEAAGDAAASETTASSPEAERATTTPATAPAAAEPPDASATPAPTAAAITATTTTEPPATPTPGLALIVRPAAPNGRTAPAAALSGEGLADQVAAAESAMRDSATTAQQKADWGHVHQVAIRALGYRPDWDNAFFETLPPEFHDSASLHLVARRALINLHSGYNAADFVPAWEIVNAAPVEDLRAHYMEAEDRTGIEWEYLAAINLIETGMGRIRGLSSAGAQGPMQFLPTTWAEAGIGEGDINEPRDAINAAARYLVRRGGPSDMTGAIWGYNNSDDYVTAVQSYAAVLRADPVGLETIYNWEIYFATDVGDIWLPAGLRNEAVIDLSDYLAASPWSAPDPAIRPD